MSSRIGAPLQVHVRAAESAHVVEVSGDLVVTSRDAVREAVERILEDGGGRVVVDATRLSHIDTASFALLVQLSDSCRTRSGALVVAGLPAAFTRLARELRLDEALAFADSVERALDSDEV
jgi:anti-anti-sigma factor